MGNFWDIRGDLYKSNSKFIYRIMFSKNLKSRIFFGKTENFSGHFYRIKPRTGLNLLSAEFTGSEEGDPKIKFLRLFLSAVKPSTHPSDHKKFLLILSLSDVRRPTWGQYSGVNPIRCLHFRAKRFRAKHFRAKHFRAKLLFRTAL